MSGHALLVAVVFSVAESQPNSISYLWRSFLVHFTCAHIVASWQECTWMSKEAQTFMKHTFMKHTHLRKGGRSL